MDSSHEDHPVWSTLCCPHWLQHLCLAIRKQPRELCVSLLKDHIYNNSTDVLPMIYNRPHTCHVLPFPAASKVLLCGTCVKWCPLFGLYWKIVICVIFSWINNLSSCISPLHQLVDPHLTTWNPHFPSFALLQIIIWYTIPHNIHTYLSFVTFVSPFLIYKQYVILSCPLLEAHTVLQPALGHVSVIHWCSSLISSPCSYSSKIYQFKMLFCFMCANWLYTPVSVMALWGVCKVWWR